jgi:hypothetical protein
MDRDHHPFAQRMREDADLFERRGLKDLAGMVRSYADELDAYEEDYSSELLTLDEAAAASGYHKDSLSRMMSEGKLPNAGKHGAPRVRRRDLPRKPRSTPLLQTSAGGPQMVQAALAEQGILPAET